MYEHDIAIDCFAEKKNTGVTRKQEKDSQKLQANSGNAYTHQLLK